METIRWGIIGTGGIANKFSDEMKFVQNSEIVAISTRKYESGERYVQRNGDVEIYTNYQEMLENSDVDVVYIATPHTLHRDHSIQAMKAGKAVMCEKPFATTALEAEEMIACARENNVLLMEAMWSRFTPAVREAKRMIEEGAIGKVKLLKTDFCFFLKDSYPEEGRLLNRKLGGGARLDVGTYAISFLNYMLPGAPTQLVSSQMAKLAGVDDVTACIANYDDAIAIIYSGICALTEREAYIAGETGTIRLPLFYSGKKFIVMNNEDESEVVKEFPRESHGFNFEIEAFNESFRNGDKENLVMPLEDSLQVMKILDNMLGDQLG